MTAMKPRFGGAFLPYVQRTVGNDGTRHTQHFVYVLEASLAFHNGLVIPLLSEFLYTCRGNNGVPHHGGGHCPPGQAKKGNC